MEIKQAHRENIYMNSRDLHKGPCSWTMMDSSLLYGENNRHKGNNTNKALTLQSGLPYMAPEMLTDLRSGL